MYSCANSPKFHILVLCRHKYIYVDKYICQQIYLCQHKYIYVQHKCIYVPTVQNPHNGIYVAINIFMLT